MSAHYRDPEFLGPRIGDKVMYAVIIVTLYFDIGSKNDVQSIQSVAALLFFICTLCGFGAAAFVPSLTLDRPLFYRELSDGCYNAFTYYLSKFFEESLLCIITSFLFAVFVYYACALEGSVFIFAFIYYLTSMIGIVLAYACAAICPSVDAANALLPTYVTFCLFFSGFFILFENIPVGWQWFSWTTFLRYAWAAMSLTHFGNSEQGVQSVFRTYNERGEVILLDIMQFYNMESGIMSDVWACIGILGGLLVFFSGVGVFVLVKVKHGNR